MDIRRMKYRQWAVILAVIVTVYIISKTSNVDTDDDVLKNMKQQIGLVQTTTSTVDKDDDVLKNMKQPRRHVQLIETAKKIRKYSKTVMVAVINDAYLPLAYSWLCNTKEMGIHNKTLFITTDEKTSLKMKRDWPEISVEDMHIDDLGGDKDYGQAGFLRVSVKRHQYIYQLLTEGVEILHFEVDCLWLRNPLPYLQSQRGYDLLVNEVSSSSQYNSGFVYIFNTDKSIQVWKLLAQKLTELARNVTLMMDKSKVPPTFHDQPVYSKIVQKRVPGIKVKVLTLDKFPDGQWYQKQETYRKTNDPYIINNNWIISITKKMNRAKKWNHWFLDENLQCNMDAVHKIVKQK